MLEIFNLHKRRPTNHRHFDSALLLLFSAGRLKQRLIVSDIVACIINMNDIIIIRGVHEMKFFDIKLRCTFL